jgi:threonine synthase
MKFYSTNDNKNTVSLDDALFKGISSDGGLFIPSRIPIINPTDYVNLDYPEFSFQLLKNFFKDSSLEDSLKEICYESFNFPILFKTISSTTKVLELYHGPTQAFKDFGARFLAQCLKRINKPITILTATSGDTGSAVASAFHGIPNIKVVVLYPKDGVSEEQRSQLNYWKDNIHPIAFDGNFDECQQNVKRALKENLDKDNLCSANSINIGRILGQVTYYAYTSLKNPSASYIIPSGNMGNALACIWAKKMGFPIYDITLATNANKSIPYFFKSNKLKKFKTIKTVANAMDVGLPSNLERIKNIFPLDTINEFIKIYSTSDEEIKKTILETFKKYNYIIDPHTACAFYALNSIKNISPQIIVATAHPIKFKKIIDEIGLEKDIDVPSEFTKFINNKFSETVVKNYKEFIKSY